MVELCLMYVRPGSVSAPHQARHILNEVLGLCICCPLLRRLNRSITSAWKVDLYFRMMASQDHVVWWDRV